MYVGLQKGKKKNVCMKQYSTLLDFKKFSEIILRTYKQLLGNG